MIKLPSYKKNLRVLEQSGSVLARLETGTIDSEFFLSGIVSKFALQTELGWQVAKEILVNELKVPSDKLRTPSLVVKEAFAAGLLDGEKWIAMLRDRNRVTHVYGGRAALALARKIADEYVPVFQRLEAEANRLCAVPRSPLDEKALSNEEQN